MCKIHQATNEWTARKWKYEDVTKPNLGPALNEANLVTLGYGKESAVFIARHQGKSLGHLELKMPKLPDGFQQAF